MELKWIIYLLIAWTISFGLTAVLMRPLLRLCKRRGMYDLPDERKVHHRGIPRLGGVLFMPAMLIGAAGTIVVQMLADYRGFPMLSVSVCVVFVGMFLIYLIGLLDDLFGLKASLKFLIQLLVSLFLPFCGLYMHNLYGLFGLYELPGWACYPLTVFVSLLIVNAINLIDGIDGLASGLSMVAVVAFGVLFFSHEMYYYALYCAALVGTVAAFFLYNMFGDVNKSTKTFMGDTGSLTLGYALTFLSIRYMMTCTATSPHQMHATARALFRLGARFAHAAVAAGSHFQPRQDAHPPQMFGSRLFDAPDADDYPGVAGGFRRTKLVVGARRLFRQPGAGGRYSCLYILPSDFGWDDSAEGSEIASAFFVNPTVSSLCNKINNRLCLLRPSQAGLWVATR